MRHPPAGAVGGSEIFPACPISCWSNSVAARTLVCISVRLAMVPWVIIICTNWISAGVYVVRVSRHGEVRIQATAWRQSCSHSRVDHGRKNAGISRIVRVLQGQELLHLVLSVFGSTSSQVSL